MIIDEQMPRYDVVLTVHRVIDVDPMTTWRTARDLDFLSVHTPLLDAAMWVRSAPARLRGWPKQVPARLSLAGGDAPGWLLLGEREGREVAFGAVGTFWQAHIEWRDVALADFAGFAVPGYGKIAANLSMRPYGARRTLLTYECRCVTTDPASQRTFARYWWVIRPFVAHIMRATVAAIGAKAQDLSLVA